MKINRKTTMVAAATAAALALAGCGGWFGDDDDDVVAASTEVSDSAGASTAAFIAYLQTFATGNETSEPLTIKDSFTVPADETSEPTPLT